MLRARGDQALPIPYVQAAISRRRNRHLDHFDVTGLQGLKDLLHANGRALKEKGEVNRRGLSNFLYFF